MPFPVSRFRFCYIDTEYVRPDYEVPPLDKCDPERVDLFSIQYVDFYLRSLNVNNLPKLKILFREPREDEFSLLMRFLPIWQRILKRLLHKKKLVPLGFVVLIDLQILAKKYQYYKNQILQVYPDLPEKLFSDSYVIQNSRFLDLQWPIQLLQGNVDVRLRDLSGNNTLDNKKTKEIIEQLLSSTLNESDQKNLNDSFIKYVNEEYRECMTHVKRKILKHLPGVYRVHPFPKSQPFN